MTSSTTSEQPGSDPECSGGTSATRTADPRAQDEPIANEHIHWLGVWNRAVAVPAGRRAMAVWIGCAVAGGVVFGPQAMRASDLTELALHEPGVGFVLAMTWLLVFLPTARMIVRAAPAAYLYSLPVDRRGAWLVAGAALIGLQLPWLVLWTLGDGLRGVAIVLANTAVIVALARWRPRAAHARFPAWRSPGQALRSIHLRALRRRAGDALLRGAGLSVLAGAAAGLLVRNNQLTGERAGVLGASILAITLIPAQIGAALVTVGAHRETTWIADTIGIARHIRIAALVHAVATVHLAAAAIAVLAATIIAGVNPWLAILAIAVALGTALGEARAMIAGEASPTVAVRVVVGAIVVAAIAVICLSVLDAAGAIAILAIGAFALLTVAP